jgi:hypothetical protein
VSILVLTWVFQHSEEKQGARLVLLALADNAHDDGSGARPKVETLARKARLGIRQTQYVLRDLEASGAIVQEGKTRSGVRIWRVVMEGVQKMHPAAECAEVQRVAPPIEEPSEEGEGSVAKAPSPSRKPDEIWDALKAVMGDATNAQTRGKRNRAVKLLKESGATPQEVLQRAKRYRQMYPGAALTDMALVNQWDFLAPIVAGPQPDFPKMPISRPPTPADFARNAEAARNLHARLSGGKEKIPE